VRDPCGEHDGASERELDELSAAEARSHGRDRNESEAAPYDRAVATGEDLRAVMRGYPHGVSVLTVDLDGERMGVTIGSLVSLSLEPPLVGVSIGKEASSYELLRQSGRFAISLLADDQDALAQHFARGVPPIAHWTGISTREGELGPPLIEGAVGWLECRIWAEHDAGDHTLFVGEVMHAARDQSKQPLLYIESAYRAL
jgi:3-hydroxy-9,10-secoandrosta-1,3,5(10)-triene-9,17-dione monooxygenase reductase component